MAEPDPALPGAPEEEIRITWVGHATFLIQIGGCNVLTDPIWSLRASPSQRFGPARFAPPGIDFEALPPIDAVLISHDHYDHLDDVTVRRLARRFPERIAWLAPLGYETWLARRGARRVVELDWWKRSSIGDRLTVVCAPCQHWTRRRVLARTRLWASWSLHWSGGRSVYFGGDSGYFPGFSEIGAKLGPFDACLLPIGAYDPRWFMKPFHMNPEEAVQAYCELGARGTFVAMHWGTFRLTEEDMSEPPVRTRAAWAAARLPERDLWIPAHGETLVLDPVRA